MLRDSANCSFSIREFLYVGFRRIKRVTQRASATVRGAESRFNTKSCMFNITSWYGTAGLCMRRRRPSMTPPAATSLDLMVCKAIYMKTTWPGQGVVFEQDFKAWKFVADTLREKHEGWIFRNDGNRRRNIPESHRSSDEIHASIPLLQNLNLRFMPTFLSQLLASRRIERKRNPLSNLQLLLDINS